MPTDEQMTVRPFFVFSSRRRPIAVEVTVLSAKAFQCPSTSISMEWFKLTPQSRMNLAAAPPPPSYWRLLFVDSELAGIAGTRGTRQRWPLSQRHGSVKKLTRSNTTCKCFCWLITFVAELKIEWQLLMKAVWNVKRGEKKRVEDDVAFFL